MFISVQAMTNVDDAIVWHEPYLNARRFGTDGPDVAKFRAVMEKGAKKRGVNFDAVLEMAKMLPFGYIGSEGLLMCVILNKHTNKQTYKVLNLKQTNTQANQIQQNKRQQNVG